MLAAILLGISAAASQSFSYLYSKRFISNNGTSIQLLLWSHLVMGFSSALLLFFLLRHISLPPFRQYVIPLLACSIFYLVGQISFFMALKYSDASRLSPLLALKIIMVALLSMFFYEKGCNLQQWIAVGACFSGALLSSWSGGLIHRYGFFYLISACFWYSASDIWIKELITAVDCGTYSGLVAAALSYLLTGVVAIGCFRFFRLPQRKNISVVLAFSLFWFAGILFLFVCMMLSSPIFANIMQSSRGLISIMLGVWLSYRGHTDLEAKIPLRAIMQRIFAAILMAGAVIIFAHGS